MLRVVSIVVLAALAAVVSTPACVAAVPVLTVESGKQTLNVTIGLPAGVKASPGSQWQLVEIDHPDVVVPVQLQSAPGRDGTPAGQRAMVANIPPRKAATGQRRFRLEPAKCAVPAGCGFQWKDLNDKSVEASEGGKSVLVYNHGTITNEALPAKETRRSRGCYVHPLYGLHGEVLTDAYPKDHYHHVGLFWAWPHIQIEGKEYDLWMYKNIKQKFVRWLAREQGPEAASLGVENGWFIGDKKVMIERVWLRAYKASEGHRALDVTLAFIPIDKTITLWGAPAKSYGGLVLRFAPRQETLITVPSGKTKEDLPDTRLVWADLTAKFAGSPCPTGAAVFVDPGHPDFPPTWLTRHYGALCVGWPGVKPRTFEPGKPFSISYRVWIHDRLAEPETLAQAYADYVAGVKAAWK